MTTAAIEATHRADPTFEPSAVRRLRLVLMTNATTSFAGGAVGLLAATWPSDVLGFDHVGWTRAVAVALMVFALDVALLAEAAPAGS